jgi:conjugative transfer signal peptidase TraF
MMHKQPTQKRKNPVGHTLQVMEKTGSWYMWDRVCYGILALGAGTFLLPVVVAFSTPFLWITSHSLPWGIYRRTHEPIGRGVLVHVCLPEDIAQYAFEREYLSAGLCPGLYQEILKPVAAIAGDEVEISAAGVTVNGVRVPRTPVYPTDSRGRLHTVRIPEGRYIVPAGQVFVLSNFHPRSWDSRYFGFLSLSAVRGTVQEVWTWQ